MPLISFKFDTPLNHKGKPLLEGCKIMQVQNMTRDSATVEYQLGYFVEDKDGFEADFQPVVSGGMTMSGDAYRTLADGEPVAGLTREADFICAAYRALVEQKISEGQAWQGKVRVSSAIALAAVSTKCPAPADGMKG